MEIDLNHAVTEVEKYAFHTTAAADKNKKKTNSINNGNSSSSSCSSKNSSDSPMASTIYLELWHACAGPLTCLPKKGNVVVYFPQGHLEQLASSPLYSHVEMRSAFGLHPQIFCKVVNVHLLANKENDEVYTQLSLLPLPEMVGGKLESKELEGLGVDGDGGGDSPPRSTPHMFCKTLTASDTSTHGGFSVPRRAAEDCFPPLDYNQQRPSQELVAKDLHGVEWRFRHIYRANYGDTELKRGGEDGELRLGIRRAIRPRNGIPDAVFKKQNSYPNVLSLVANATSTKSIFNVIYSPRCSGVVTGVSDFDPYRWPNSEWKCFMVRWDENVVPNHQDRVSPWEIDPSVSLPPLTIQPSSRLKKLRTGLHPIPPDNPGPGGSGCLDFEESIIRPSKVLQGQENVGFVVSSPLFGRETTNHRPPSDFEVARRLQNPILAGTPKAMMNIGEVVTRPHHPHPAAIYSGFTESDRFPKVLQGQEICQLRSLTAKGGDLDFGAWRNPNMYPTPPRANNNNFFTLATTDSLNRSLYFPYGDVCKTVQDPGARPYVTRNFHFNASPIQVDVVNVGDEEVGKIKLQPPSEQHNPKVNPNNEASFAGNATGCKLFGFTLTAAEVSAATSSQNSGKRSCTKVHKQGSLVGRAIDLSRLKSYDDLLIELERLFSMEGLLRDPMKGWRILYTDSEDDVMVVGDDPWHEFCTVVTKIHIHTKEEVEKMTLGMMGDDNRSCLDQGPAVMEASKSSSVGQPDSSSTVAKA
ncbi:unnamed protein product [Linum tenue]|uniref:Auxin response factor n=1 Tax=Linum tenue TaxID=586396 RepID=A0AAV0QC49_9ROSI|nr:unnamed protein product [Linum tenue]